MKTSNVPTSLFWAGEEVECIRYLGQPGKDAWRFRVTLKSGEVREENVTSRELLDMDINAVPRCPATSAPRNHLPEDDAKRAQYPMADGLIDYFPNALAEVSRVSFIGSQKHNKGEPMHWARHKSTDHRNKIARHLVDAGGVDVVMVDGKEERVRHSAYLAWRALANLQDELEREEGYPPSRASRFPKE